MIRSTWRGAITGALLFGAPAAAQQPAAPAFTFSGVTYARYQYRTDAAQRNANAFDLERTYLTFRMPAGDRASVRVTTDVFQQSNAASAAYYGGWTIRLKYAYLQYDYLKTARWTGTARLGVVHTVVIDHEEQFFPRWISQVALERAGYFASADAGMATSITLPGRWGEVYGTIVNGGGYTSRETDRFKDVAVRLSLTPFAAGGSPLLRTFTLSPWALSGATASQEPGARGLRKDRYGIFAGVRDPRLAAGVDLAANRETGEDVTAPIPTRADSSGRVAAGFLWAKPWASQARAPLRPLGFLVRYDKITPRTNAPAVSTAAADYHIFIAGLTWALTSAVGMSFDYQEVLADRVGLANPSKAWFAHFVAEF